MKKCQRIFRAYMDSSAALSSAFLASGREVSSASMPITVPLYAWLILLESFLSPLS